MSLYELTTFKAQVSGYPWGNGRSVFNSGWSFFSYGFLLRSKLSSVYKCLRNFVPIYLKNYFKVNNDVHNYNTRQRRNIHPNKTNLVLGGRTFKNSGRLAFNLLPSEIKEASSLAIFKRLLKGHFI